MMQTTTNTSRWESFRGARLVRAVLTVAAAGSSLFTACDGGSGSGLSGNPVDAFIAALHRGADARCMCGMVSSQNCMSGKTRIADCIRGAVPETAAADFPSCAARLLNDYNDCQESDGVCRDGAIVAAECDMEVEAARATCQLPPAVDACLQGGGTAPGMTQTPNDAATMPGNEAIPGNGGAPGMTPGNGGTPGSGGTPVDEEPIPGGGGSSKPPDPPDPPDPSGMSCSNECEYAGDGACDDGGQGAEFDLCTLGTDCDDCGPRDGEVAPSGPGCSNECLFAGDGVCDDGGPGSELNLCELGTDCDDCGQR